MSRSKNSADDPVEDLIGVGVGEEPGFERARGHMDALIEHGVEECGVAVDILSPGTVVVRHLGVGEEHGEHRVRGLDDVGDAFGLQARSDGRAQSVRGTADMRVHIEFGRQLECGQGINLCCRSGDRYGRC